MKQLYTLTLALIVGASVFGQQKPHFSEIPDCGSFFSTFGSYCKTPVFANGKLTHYTLRVMRDLPQTSAMIAGSSFVGFQSIQPVSFHYMIFGLKMDMMRSGKPSGILDNNNDSIIVHIKKSQLHWINDSTAVIHKP